MLYNADAGALLCGAGGDSGEERVDEALTLTESLLTLLHRRLSF